MGGPSSHAGPFHSAIEVIGFVLAQFPRLPIPFRGSLTCLILSGPSLPASRRAGMASPPMSHPRPPGIESFCIKKGTVQ
jgi:hypothetical protein